MNEDLRDWFGKGGKGGVGGGGWDEYNTKGERTGKCVRGDDDDGEGPKPKCLSKEKAAKMTKKEIAAAVKRKRKEDPVADRPGKGGKPIMSSNKIDEGLIDKLKGRKVIGRTASGGKIYQSTGAKKSNVTYGGQTQDEIIQANKQKKVDKERKEKVKSGQYDDPWLKSSPAAERRMHYQQLKGDMKEAKTPDHEHSMARSELATIEKAVKRLKNKMKGEGNIEAWVQSKITKAADYIDSAADYLDSGEHNVHGSMDEEKDPCWKGYKQVGMKKKAGKEVPNCVPESVLPEPIDPKKHRQAQRSSKIRNLAQQGATEGERKAAEGKTKGPKLFGENIGLVDKILLEMEAEVVNEENKPTNPKLWAKWKAKAKAKFDVYPSAYANGWAAKGYKSEGGEWKSVSENVTIEDANGNTFAEVIDLVVNEENDEEKYCKKCEKMEKRSECKYGPETWDKMTDDDSDDVNEAVRMPSKTGNIIMVNLTWRGKYYGAKLFFPFTKMPSRKEVQSEIEKIYPGSKVYSFRVCEHEPGQPIIQVTEEEKKKLNDPIRTPGENKKFKVHVKDPSTGNINTVRFGDPNMEIKRDDPKRLKAFRSRHGCDTPAAKDKTTAKYWSCYQWRKGQKVDN
jgi:hypothetical protein